ncbi:MAG: uroporphyrinogen-III synthase [Hyphomicrobiales bacterium]|nr:MAG: uroporphyrinogen-III synthase [Hyphomicrobiales bacterium]
MVRMLVTRPEPDASETAARLAALDIDALVEPLLIAEILTTTLPAAGGFAALAVTSANALRALHDRGELPRLRNLPVYTVGDRTAAVARHYGFAQVTSADGSFGDLVALLARTGLAGPVLYPAARHQSGDLGKALAPHGIMVITTPVYSMNPARQFSRDLAAEPLDAALFYSRRTAETFAGLAGNLRNKSKLGMLCMSEAIAEPLIAAHFVRVSLAEHPSEGAMMALALSFARDQKMGMIGQ